MSRLSVASTSSPIGTTWKASSLRSHEKNQRRRHSVQNARTRSLRRKQSTSGAKRASGCSDKRPPGGGPTPSAVLVIHSLRNPSQRQEGMGVTSSRARPRATPRRRGTSRPGEGLLRSGIEFEDGSVARLQRLVREERREEDLLRKGRGKGRGDARGRCDDRHGLALCAGDYPPSKKIFIWLNERASRSAPGPPLHGSEANRLSVLFRRGRRGRVAPPGRESRACDNRLSRGRRR